MKKILALVLAMMMIFALCAGCGSTDDSSDTTEEAATVETEEAEEPAAEAEAEAPVAEPEEEPAEEPAEEVEEPADIDSDASGEMASGESGEMDVDSYTPDQGDYTKDFEGYRAYCIDGYLADSFHPEDLEEDTLAVLNDETLDEDTYNTSYWASIIDLGVVLSYEDFLAY